MRFSVANERVQCSYRRPVNLRARQPCLCASLIVPNSISAGHRGALLGTMACTEDVTVDPWTKSCDLDLPVTVPLSAMMLCKAIKSAFSYLPHRKSTLQIKVGGGGVRSTELFYSFYV